MLIYTVKLGTENSRLKKDINLQILLHFLGWPVLDLVRESFFIQTCLDLRKKNGVSLAVIVNLFCHLETFFLISEFYNSE